MIPVHQVPEFCKRYTWLRAAFLCSRVLGDLFVGTQKKHNQVRERLRENGSYERPLGKGDLELDLEEQVNKPK